jgi:DNA-binding CsgD family transcriptional regulator
MKQVAPFQRTEATMVADPKAETDERPCASVADPGASELASVPSLADILRPLAAQVGSAYEVFLWEARQELEKDDARARGAMRRDVYALWKIARDKANPGDGSADGWRADEEAVLHRVCDQHFPLPKVFKWEPAVRDQVAQYAREQGISLEAAWRELVCVAVLETVDDAPEGPRRRRAPDARPFGAFPIADADALLSHFCNSLKREVKTALYRRPPGSEYQEALTELGEMPESEDLGARFCEDSEARLDLATFEGLIEPEVLTRLDAIADADPNKHHLLTVLASLTQRERELLVIGGAGRDYARLQRVYGGSLNSLHQAADRAKRKVARLLAEAGDQDDTHIA